MTEIQNTTKVAFIPEDNAPQTKELTNNPFFAFMMALGVTGADAQRALFEYLELKSEVSSLKIENYLEQWDSAKEGMNIDNIAESAKEIQDIQTNLTREKKEQDLTVSLRMTGLANQIKGSTAGGYSALDSAWAFGKFVR